MKSISEVGDFDEWLKSLSDDDLLKNVRYAGGPLRQLAFERELDRRTNPVSVTETDDDCDYSLSLYEAESER